eukprot:336667-Chlamydomonas_euryale.AAC.4
MSECVRAVCCHPCHWAETVVPVPSGRCCCIRAVAKPPGSACSACIGRMAGGRVTRVWKNFGPINTNTYADTIADIC